MKKIGIIGGAGVAATNKLCELIEVELTKSGAYRDCHHIEMIIFQGTQSPSRSMFLEGRAESFVESYIDMAKKLESCGAQILCMCCNTAHYAFDIIQNSIKTNMINLIKEIVLRAKRYKIVGLIASDGCLKGKVYETYFAKYAPDVKIIYPDSKYQKLVTQGICNIKNIHRFDKLDSKENPKVIFKEVIRHLNKKIESSLNAFNTHTGGGG